MVHGAKIFLRYVLAKALRRGSIPRADVITAHMALRWIPYGRSLWLFLGRRTARSRNWETGSLHCALLFVALLLLDEVAFDAAEVLDGEVDEFFFLGRALESF